jgi:DNA-binding NarL/FixJ family response regulator
MPVLTIALVDDQPLTRQGLAAVLAPVTDLELVVATDRSTVLPRNDSGRLTVDLVIDGTALGHDQPDTEVIRSLAAQVPVLVMSASFRSEDILAAIGSGASGVVSKSDSEPEILQAIRAAASGPLHLSRRIADVLRPEERSPAMQRDHDVLSPRERQTLAYIARGFTHQQTARRMGVATTTVGTYVERVRHKLGVGNKAELALASLRYTVVESST